MTRMWFCYELENMTWSPVVYRTNGGAPELKDVMQRSKIIEVPADCIGSDREPMFGALKQRFPLEVSDG